MAWAVVAAVAFGVTQTLNRKSNQLIGPFRTAFGLLVVVEAVLVVISFATERIELILAAPAWALASFALATLVHFGGGWTLLAVSQERVGVARTGALVAAAPLVGAIAAAALLHEPLGLLTAAGVLVVVAGVAVLSLSMRNHVEGVTRRSRFPGHALTVALLWGLSPILIRRGLVGLADPIAGLTFGLGVTVVIYGLGLTLTRGWGPTITGRSVMWTVLGGLTGAVAISAQWISFDLTTIAVALSLQQMSVLVVVALAPLMFPEPIERINTLLLVGTAAMLTGTTLVVLQRF